MNEASCPLCRNLNRSLFFEEKNKRYWRCQTCSLIYLERIFVLSNKEEKAQYDLHQNDPNDQGYRSFLNNLREPLLQFVQKQAYGLDYGCGPGPTLSLMLEEQGFRVELYDKFYSADNSVLSRTYDFIVSSETFEHFYDPGTELKTITNILRSGGTLGIMTKLYNETIDFSHWHYKNDPTHISFYSLETMHYICQHFNFQMLFSSDNVVILKNLD